MQQEKGLSRFRLDTQMLYARIMQAIPGQTISYDDLNAVIGRDVQTEAYACLFSARKKAQRLNRKAFGVIPNVGLKCMEDEEIVGAGLKAIDQVRRRSRKGFGTLVCLKDYAGLPDFLKTQHNAVATILMMVNRMTKPQAVKVIEAAVSEKLEKLSHAQTLELFMQR